MLLGFEKQEANSSYLVLKVQVLGVTSRGLDGGGGSEDKFVLPIGIQYLNDLSRQPLLFRVWTRYVITLLPLEMNRTYVAHMRNFWDCIMILM